MFVTFIVVPTNYHILQFFKGINWQTSPYRDFCGSF